MKYPIQMGLIIVCLLTLTGCFVPTAGRQMVTREVVWAKMGTPARITDEREIRVLVPDGEGGWLPGRAKLTGMVTIDEPTLDYYRSLHAERKEP